MRGVGAFIRMRRATAPPKRPFFTNPSLLPSLSRSLPSHPPIPSHPSLPIHPHPPIHVIIIFIESNTCTGILVG